MKDDINNIKNDLQEYFEVKMDLIRLHTAESISRILNSAVNSVIAGYLLFFILFFLSLSAGYFIGSLLHSDELGFLCVAGLYVLILIVFLFFRKQIIEKPIIIAITKLFFPKFNEDEEEI